MASKNLQLKQNEKYCQQFTVFCKQDKWERSTNYGNLIRIFSF